MDDESEGARLDVQIAPGLAIIAGVNMELPAFIVQRLQKFAQRRDKAQAEAALAQAALMAYGQGVCDGMGLTADGRNVAIDLDTMTYRLNATGKD